LQRVIENDQDPEVVKTAQKRIEELTAWKRPDDHQWPEPPQVWTREKIISRAAYLGQRYENESAYQADIKPLNFADLKKRKAAYRGGYENSM
jgi:hypothetical protein